VERRIGSGVGGQAEEGDAVAEYECPPVFGKVDEAGEE
jgi:hypothetical protein